MSYDDFSALPSTWFQKQTSAYDPDRQLFDLLATEAFNRDGVDLVYYVTSYDTSATDYPNSDELFGEDGNRVFIRKFPIKGYFELPKELQMANLWGIEGLDSFQVFVTERHFSAASEIDGYDSYIPQEADMLYSPYNNRYYTINDVSNEDEVFLQKKHFFSFTVERYKDSGISLTSATSADMPELEDITNIDDDLFDISDYITDASEDVLYPTSADNDSNNIWGD